MKGREQDYWPAGSPDEPALLYRYSCRKTVGAAMSLHVLFFLTQWEQSGEMYAGSRDW